MRNRGLRVLAIACVSLAPGSSAQPLDVARGLPRTGAERRVARYFESIRGKPPRLLAFLREMPKGGDLHTHLTGAVYAESLAQWAAEDGDCVDRVSLALSAPPCDADAGRPPAAAAVLDRHLYRRMIDAWSMRNWQRGQASGHDQFFDTFALAVRATSGRTGDMLAEVARRAAHGRVSYLEVMVTLDRRTSSRMAAAAGWDDDLGQLREKLLAEGLASVVETARAEVDAAERRKAELLRCGTKDADPGCAVEVRYLFQVLRGQPKEQVFAQLLAAFETAHRDPRVVGLNLVMPEDWLVPVRDFSLHMRMLGELKKSYPSVRIALHAGELWPGLVPPEVLRFHIRESILVGHAERIGHGVSVMHEDDPYGLLREMARRKVLVEVCLTSNDLILGVRGADHPLSVYLEEGVPVALATDDEGVSRSEMTLEYMKAAQEQGLGYLQLKRMARASLEHAFVDEVTKARLLLRHDDAVARFEASVLASQRRTSR